MALAGAIISGLLAMGEIYARGPLNAWESYKLWWLITALSISILPFAYIAFQLVLEGVLFGTILLVLLPAAWLGDRWNTILKWTGRLLFGLLVLLCAWIVFGIGSGIATSDTGVPTPTLPPPSGMPPAPLPPSFSWIAWFHAHSGVVLAIGIGIGGFAKTLVESVLSEWLKKRFVKEPKTPATSERIVPLYGADGRVVREIAVERIDRTRERR